MKDRVTTPSHIYDNNLGKDVDVPNWPKALIYESRRIVGTRARVVRL